MSNPNDLASFRAALLEGDRRLVRRRRTRTAGGVLADRRGDRGRRDLAPELTRRDRARRGSARGAGATGADPALRDRGRAPGREVQQRISRWSQGDRSRTISVAGGRTVEQAADGDVVRVRLEPGGRIDTIKGGAPDPLLEYRKVLDQATDAEEVTLDGVEAYRLEMPRQVAYLRRSDRLPLRVELEGGVTLRYPVVEYVREAQLDLR